MFEGVYSKEWQYLVDIDMHFILELSVLLGIDCNKIVRSSTLRVSGDRSERLVNIASYLKRIPSMKGVAGKNYIDENYLKVMV